MQAVRADLLTQAFQLQLLLQRGRRACNGGLTRIVAQARGHVDGRGARSQVDDGARLSLAHARQHLIDTQHGALEVDLDGAPEILEALLRRELAVRHPCVVHHDVHRSEGLGQRRERLPHARHISDVAFVRLNSHAFILLARGLGFFLCFDAEVEER